MYSTPVSLLECIRRQGERAAWERFVELYTPILYVGARRTGCQDADAADLAEEVLTLLVRKLPDFVYDPDRSFRSWLRIVARNCWNNLQRGKGPPLADQIDLDEMVADEEDAPFWET